MKEQLEDMNSTEMEEVGIIVGEASSTQFYFSVDAKKQLPRWEYVVVFSNENDKEVQVIAQVDKVQAISQAFKGDVDFRALQKISESGIDDLKALCSARILGYLDNDGSIHQPRKAVRPGGKVYRAPDSLLSKFFSYNQEEGLYIGSLLARPEVKVQLSVKGFRRHLAIIAQTGAGKSYCAGVLIEELLEKGATIVVLDPHADYVFLSKRRDGNTHRLADRITVFRNPSSTGRYDQTMIRNLRLYELCFSDLAVDDICEIAGISERYVNIRDVIRNAYSDLEQKKPFSPKELLKKLGDYENHGNKKIRDAALSAKRYLRKLARMKVFTTKSTPTVELLKPMHVSVVDLSGLEDEACDYIAYKILRDIFLEVTNGRFAYPVFIFVEEAHKFIPKEGVTYSTDIIKKVAAEGRKFGIFLIVITQRPSKINSDVLSQCNSQIIMRITNPKDQQAIIDASERLSQNLLEDLPGLEVGEAVIVGEVVKIPVIVKVRERVTMEGGADIDVINMLKKAREDADKEVKNAKRLADELNHYRRWAYF